METIQVIQDPLARTGFVLLGIIGGTIYLAMTIFYYRTVQNMEKDKETAITKFFLKDNTLDAFKIMAISGFILVITLTTELTGVLIQNSYIATIARITLLVPILGLAYFSYTLQKNTATN